MKDLVKIVLLLVFLSGCVAHHRFLEKNLLRNGDMEGKYIGAGWKRTKDGGGFTVDIEREYGDGKQSLKHTNGEMSTDIYQTFKAEKGKTYRVNFWAKVEPGNHIEWVLIYDSNWRAIKSLNINAFIESGIDRITYSEWEEYELTFKATDEIMYISTRNVVSGKSIWLDDVSIVEVKSKDFL